MFSDIKTPSKRVLLTDTFVDYLQANYPTTLDKWLKIYYHEVSTFGLEFFNISKIEEEILGKLLLDFLSYEKTIRM